MIGTQIIIPQVLQTGIIQGLSCSVPRGAANVIVQAIMNADDITTVGVVVEVHAILSVNFGATWLNAASTGPFYSGPPPFNPMPDGPWPPKAPLIAVPVWGAATHYSGVLNFYTESNVGLYLTFIDSTGAIL